MKKFIIVIFLLITVVGCSNNQQTESKNPNQSRMVTMILGVKDESALTQRQFTFKLSNNSSFTPQIKLGNHFPEKNTYSFFFLLDYKQISVVYNGQSKNVIDIVTEPDSEVNFDINVQNIPSGRHDFIVVAVRKPDVHLNENKIVPPEQTFIARRATIIVGDDTPPNHLYSNIETLKSELPKNMEFITENKNPSDLKDALSLINTKTNKELWLNFISKNKDQKYALVTMIDNRQIDIFDQSFCKSNSEGLISLPIKDTFPTDNKQHELIIMIIESPFERYENEKGEFLSKVPWAVNFVNKITIQ